MKLKVLNSLIGLCVATAAVSCSDALVDNLDKQPVGGGESDIISFVVADNNTTRGGSFGNRPCGGAYLRSANGADSLYLNMAVADFDDPSTRAEEISNANKPSLLNMTCRIRTSGSQYMYYFENATFENNGNVWSSDPVYYWMTDESHFNFYGYYAPADAEGVTFNGNSSDAVPVPTLDYTVPADVKKHFDLAYSGSAATEYIANSNETVPLNIKHALSRIAFKTGSEMATGEIKSVSIKNVYNKGTLDLGDGSWNLDTSSVGDFTLSGLNVSGNGQDITGSNNFMLLPQEIAAGEIEIMFQPEGETEAKPYTASLANLSWEAGQSYTYTITIKPDYQIEIEIDDKYKTVDAHYVIAKAKVKVPVEKTDLDWNLSVTAKDEKGNDVDVTIISAAKAVYKSYYDQGYWLDKVANNGVVSSESARGEASESGVGEQDLYIFIPENVSDSNRDIVISDKSTGQKWTITQRHPAWAANDNNFGWEQIDDNESAQWGFYSKEKQVYVYNYSNWGSGTNSSIENMIKNLIQQYDADGYVQYGEYTTWTGFRWWVSIDYSGFANLNEKALSIDNGFQNTLDLNKFAGTAYTKSFENALSELKRVRHNNDLAFRERVNNDPNDVPQKIEDSNITNPMLPYILKKNKYYINIFTGGDDDDSSVETISPIIYSNDVVWFLPAYGEFNKSPNSVDTPIVKSDCWSSTAVNNSTDSYSGAGIQLVRKETKKIRVCRKRP